MARTVSKVIRREGAQGVLHAVAELAEHLGRHVLGGMSDEEDADPLRPDEARDQLDLGHERLVRVAEEQVGLVEEEDELGLLDRMNG